MTGDNTSYSLSRAIFTTGKLTYKVAIVDAKSVVKGKIFSGNYTVSSSAPANHAPTLSLIKAETSVITDTAYTVTLNAKDVDANLNAITMNWGDNSEPETLTAADSKDLVFSHIYTSASSFGWNAFASDKGTPVLNSKSVSQLVTVSNPVPVEIIEPPIKTTGYTKIANDGSELSDNAALGSKPKDWACTKDNKTGLIWEVKTDDGGLRDKDWIYNWGNLERDSISQLPNCSTKDNCNAYTFTDHVNTQGLCGADNWRMPTKEELKSLVFCSDGKYNKIIEGDIGAVCENNTWDTIKTTTPTINEMYFPNTVQKFFASSSSASTIYSDDSAWSVSFDSSFSSYGWKKYNDLPVRLVR